MTMTFVTVWAIVLEVRGRPARWNKLARTGVVSRGGSLLSRRRTAR